MSRMLTDQDRAFIYEQLSMASDDILIRAYQEFDRTRTAALSIRKQAGQATEPEEAEPDVIRSKNVNPGETTITKIGAATEIEIIKMLQSGQQPPEKYTPHLKLLWKRDKVMFDGKEWYV